MRSSKVVMKDVKYVALIVFSGIIKIDENGMARSLRIAKEIQYTLKKCLA